MKLTVIVIHYRSEGFIRDCLKKVRTRHSHKIIVVDNQGSPQLMKKLAEMPGVRVLGYMGNLGFAAANNRAIRESESRYIMCLNADCFLEPGYIDSCIGFLDKNPGYASCQGKLLLKNQPGIIDSTGNVLTKSGFAYNENHKSPDRKIPEHDIFGVCAAAAVYRRSALEKAKTGRQYFDEDFFAYLEDVDLDMRLKMLGYRAGFVPDAAAHHVREATTAGGFRFRMALRNRLYLVIKNFGFGPALLNTAIYGPLLLFLPDRLKNCRLVSRMYRKRRLVVRRKVQLARTPYMRWLRKLIRRSQAPSSGTG